MTKNGKPSYVPVVIILVSLGLFLVSSQIDNFSIQTKMGFVGKIGLLIGIIGLWLFTFVPMWSSKKK